MFGDVRTRRSKEEIKKDRAARMKADHIRSNMIRNLKYQAINAKMRESSAKKDKKGGSLPVLEDLVSRYSLHKLTV